MKTKITAILAVLILTISTPVLAVQYLDGCPDTASSFRIVNQCEYHGNNRFYYEIDRGSYGYLPAKDTWCEELMDSCLQGDLNPSLILKRWLLDNGYQLQEGEDIRNANEGNQNRVSKRLQERAQTKYEFDYMGCENFLYDCMAYLQQRTSFDDLERSEMVAWTDMVQTTLIDFAYSENENCKYIYLQVRTDKEFIMINLYLYPGEEQDGTRYIHSASAEFEVIRYAESYMWEYDRDYVSGKYDRMVQSTFREAMAYFLGEAGTTRYLEGTLSENTYISIMECSAKQNDTVYIPLKCNRMKYNVAECEFSRNGLVLTPLYLEADRMGVWELTKETIPEVLEKMKENGEEPESFDPLYIDLADSEFGVGGWYGEKMGYAEISKAVLMEGDRCNLYLINAADSVENEIVECYENRFDDACFYVGRIEPVG